MPDTTNIPYLLDAGSHASRSVLPRVVRSATDVSFLSRESVVTRHRLKAYGGTLAAERPVVRVPRVVRASEVGTERFTLLQKWEGVVLEADAETFTARLLDSNGELPPHQATFSRNELSSEEAGQIALGAPFVWTIGYRHRPSRERISYLYFRRLPPWSEDELKSARNRSEKGATAIGWK